MQHFTTLNDLILFAYCESGMPDASDYQKMINADGKLSKQYKSIKKVKNYLNKLKVGPSEFVIKNLLNYSKALSVTRSQSAGNISLVMN
jgi:hypothetical protein